MRSQCSKAFKTPASGELGLHVVLTVGDHPMLGLTLARVMMIVVDELQADRVPIGSLEISVQGPLPRRQGPV